MRMFKVYQILFPNGKSYIGITSTSIRRRIKKHKSEAKRLNRLPIHRALNKFKDIKVKKLKEAKTKEKIFSLEKYYIKRKKSLVPKGYNVSKGGDGVFGVKKNKKQIESSKRVYKKYLQKYINSKKVKLKCSNGKIYSSINSACRNLGLDSTCIRRVLVGKQKQTKGFTFTAINKKYEKRVAKHKKPVYNCKNVIRSDGKRFNSAVTAARELKVTDSAVRNVLKNRKTHVKGFSFTYA